MKNGKSAQHGASLSLARRSMLLFTLSIVIQIFLIASFLFQADGEEFAVQTGRARDINNDVREVVQSDIATIIAVDQAIQGATNNVRVQTNLERLHYWSNHLNGYYSSDNDRLLLRNLNEKTDALVALLNQILLIRWNETSAQTQSVQARRSSKVAQAESADPQQYERLAEKCETIESELEKLLSEMVVPLRTQKFPENKNSLRHFWYAAAIIGSLLNITVLLLMAIFLSKQVTNRLAALNETCLQFERGRQTRIIGSSKTDEIGRLEFAVQQMFDAINETVRNQQALFENVHDVLCSIDDKMFCFKAINQSAAEIFGYTTKQLIDSPVAALFRDPENKALAKFKQIVMQRAQPPLHMCTINGEPFEAEIKKGDGTTASTSWSVKYVPAEGSLLCVVHDITKRKAAENMRREVVQMVNHDLRSPLAAIQVIYAILHDYANLNEMGQKNLAIAHANTDRMRRLISDLLDIGKLEAGMLQLQRTNVSLSSVIQQSIQSVQTLAKLKDIALVNNSASDFVLFADPHRLEQILINLLSNAIKFSPKGQSILVSAIETGRYIEISVQDFGRGVPAHMTKSIFDRFSQVYASDASQKGGSGLGLAICKALVLLHDGDIGVESTEGAGSRFYFRIPNDVPSMQIEKKG
ncbi:MAG TPA: ATP-binding protein [Drouetiella sp.]|jgi:PAS domain S-box-containing protein